jgi:hypothetical protein
MKTLVRIRRLDDGKAGTVTVRRLEDAEDMGGVSPARLSRETAMSRRRLERLEAWKTSSREVADRFLQPLDDEIVDTVSVQRLEDAAPRDGEFRAMASRWRKVQGVACTAARRNSQAQWLIVLRGGSVTNSKQDVKKG